MPFKRKDSRYWWVTINGVRQSSGTTDYEAAKALEAKAAHQQWLQTHMGMKPPRSWKEAVVKFLKERQHQRTIRDTMQRLAWFDKYLGEIQDIRQITRELMGTIMEDRGVKPKEACSANSTANRYVAAVSAVLNEACKSWDWIERAPKLLIYPEPEGRDAFLTVEQWKKLEPELPQHLRWAATFALATGLRDGKVFGLEWSQIDMQKRTLSTVGTANKLGVTIPLNATAMHVLREINALPVRHLTRVLTYRGKPVSDYGRAWYKAQERAGLGKLERWKDEQGKWHERFTGFPWHGLRHTFNSWLAQNGVDKEKRNLLCGWSGRNKDTADRYTHLFVDHLRPYTEVIDTLLCEFSCTDNRKSSAQCAK